MDGRCFCPDQKRLAMACGGRNVINLVCHRVKRGIYGLWACFFRDLNPHIAVFASAQAWGAGQACKVQASILRAN
jgi:hypothetical protein